MQYRVIWEIDIDAASPKEAAQEAFECMQKPTDATVFEVTDSEGKHHTVDLLMNEVKTNKDLL